MTLEVAVIDGVDSWRSAIYGLANPASGAQTVTVTFSGATDSVCGSITVTGSDTATCFSNHASATGASGNPSVNCTSSSSELVMDNSVTAGAANNWTAGAGQTERWDAIPSGGNASGTGTTEAGAATVTMSETSVSGNPWAQTAASFKAAAGGGATLNTAWFRPSEQVFRSRRQPDTMPALALTPATLPPKIAGMAWFEPRDRDVPKKRVTVESPPAIALTPDTLPPKVAGMAWFEPPDIFQPRRLGKDWPAAFGQPTVQPSTIAGMAWFEPPDRDKPAIKVRVESPPAIALTPSTLPPQIAGMAWFEPWDFLQPRRRPVDTPSPFVTPPAPITLAPLVQQDVYLAKRLPRETAVPIVLGPTAPPVPISGMAWFEPLERPNLTRGVTANTAPAWMPQFILQIEPPPPVEVPGLRWNLEWVFGRKRKKTARERLDEILLEVVAEVEAEKPKRPARKITRAVIARARQAGLLEELEAAAEEEFAVKLELNAAYERGRISIIAMLAERRAREMREMEDEEAAVLLLIASL